MLARMLLLITLLLPLAASAEVFKCTDANGKVVFQQTTCTGASAGAEVELPTASATGKASAGSATNLHKKALGKAHDIDAKTRQAAAKHSGD